MPPSSDCETTKTKLWQTFGRGWLNTPFSATLITKSQYPQESDRVTVNAGEKMHRRAGVKMHHGRRQSAATLNSAFQFDPMSLLSRPDLATSWPWRAA
jgi:hypothetical protein